MTKNPNNSGLTAQQTELEKEYLTRVTNEISEQINDATLAARGLKTRLGETQKNMWNDVSAVPNSLVELDQLVQAKAFLDEIEAQNRQYLMTRQQINKLNKMLISPYFGRIDFTEKGENYTEKLYIGLGTVVDKHNNEFLVYDWRAPISSMYYDYEIGDASYTCPDGIIEGKIELKRQYKIVHEKIELMFDCTVTINDEMLQEALSQSTNNKMRTIVTTIQREQNQIIRDDSHSYLIVSGPAGCGKTSVALHRIAWLLYKKREFMSAENILVLSPNDVFNDYISNVLPELGEQDVRQTTYADLIKRLIGENYSIGNFNRQIEMILNGSKDILPEGIKFKNSLDFYKIIKAYLEILEASPIAFGNITVDEKVIIPYEDLVQLYKYEYSYLPIKKRIDKIKQRIIKILDAKIGKLASRLMEQLSATGDFVDEREIRHTAYEQAKVHYSEALEYAQNELKFDAIETYMNLFNDIDLLREIAEECGVSLPKEMELICDYTIAQLDLEIVSHEDTTPIALIKVLAGDYPNTKDIKHVVIDEGQDYTILQLELITKMFNQAGITFLGDPGQSINPLYSVEDFDSFDQVLDDGKIAHIKLNKSYRPTLEINNLTSRILGLKYLNENINRNGNLPNITEFAPNDFTNAITYIVEKIAEFERMGNRSIAVICTSQSETNEVHRLINAYLPISLVSTDDDTFTTNTCVIPSYLAKGLEFDAVIVFNASKTNYPNNQYRKLLYTVCSRALHELNIVTIGEVSPILKENGCLDNSVVIFENK